MTTQTYESPAPPIVLPNIAELCRGRRPAQLERVIDKATDILWQVSRALQSKDIPEATAKRKDIQSILEKCPKPNIFIVFVNFIKCDDWRAILVNLLDTINSETATTSQEDGETASESEVAWAQISVIYPWLYQKDLKDTSIETLMQDKKLKYLSSSVLIDETDQSRFSAELQNILSSEQGLWPLIANVSVKLRASVLKAGVVLVDVPGLLDSNEARSQIANHYIKRAKYIYACAPCSRVVDDKVTRDMLDGSLRRQMLLDGTQRNVTIVGTNADVINLREAERSLNLGAAYIELKDQEQALNQKLQELQTQIERNNPSLGAKQKAPSRGTPAKKAKITVTKSAARYTTGGCPGTDVDMQLEMARLVLSREDLQYEQSENNHQMHRLALEARKNSCIRAIRKEFEDRQRALLTAYAHEGNGVTQSDIDADMEVTLKSLSVHIVSSLAYQVASGSRGKEDICKGFDTVEDSGITALRQHCIRLTDDPRREVYVGYITDVIRQFNSLKVWVDRSPVAGDANSSAVQRGEVQIRARKHKEMKQKMTIAAEKAIRSLREAKRDRLDTWIRTAIAHARRVAPGVAFSWGGAKKDDGLAWNTLRAVLRGAGRFLSSRGVSYDFNEQLGKGLKDRLLTNWSICFTQLFPSIINDFPWECTAIIEDFVKDFEQRNKENGSSQHQLDTLRRQIPNHEAHLYDVTRQMLQEVDQEQRTINRLMIEPVIEKAMAPAYDRWPTYLGKGVRKAMVTDLETHVADNLDMFDNSKNTIDSKLNRLIAYIIKPQFDIMVAAADRIAKDCNDVTLGAGDINIELRTDAEKATMDAVAEILRGAGAPLRDASNEDVDDDFGAEVTDEDEEFMQSDSDDDVEY